MLFEQFGMMVQYGSVLVFVLNIILHVCCASAVAIDISRLSKLKVAPGLLPGWVWLLASLIGGVFVAVAYWVMHHSTLARRL